MMALVRTWLLGVTAAAILSALADGLMAEGPVKQAGRLVCALALLCAVLRPLGRVEVTEFSSQWAYDQQQRTQQLQKGAEEQMKAVIEQQLAAYSMDKAVELGLTCQVSVTCQSAGDGVFLPASVQVVGEADPEQQQQLAEVLCGDLGLEPQSITFQEVAAP
jgi:stage III sporulation protein AF